MEKQTENILQPPADVPEMQQGKLIPLSDADPIADHITTHYWDLSSPPSSWQVARLSQSAYLYQEASTEWALVAKYYSVKKGSSADSYAHRELGIIKQVRTNDMGTGDFRAIYPIDVWRGVLFLRYMDGLTLEDMIAVRRSRPGRLIPALQSVAGLFIKLHKNNVHSDVEPEFDKRLEYFRGILANLTKYGILQDNPIISSGLENTIDDWSSYKPMRNFTPVTIHGDATTTNFIYPWAGGVVAIDWERSKTADPASDLGRLMAEITHSVNQHGGSVAEAQPFVQCVYDTDIEGMQDEYISPSFFERTRFYQALSTLRIARNGWVPKFDRMGLVAQAFGLLATL